MGYEFEKRYTLEGYPVTLQGIGSGFNAIENTVKIMANTIRESSRNIRIRNTATSIVYNVPEKDQMGEVSAVLGWVHNHTRYVRDPQGTETLHSPLVALDKIDQGFNFQGDCFSGDTDIIVRHRKSNKYEIKTFTSLKECWPDYEALSYNFESQSFEFKDIIGFVHKKQKQTYKVSIVAKRPIVCTDTHEFYAYEGRGREKRKICQKKLKEIDLTRYWKRQILSAKKIPIIGSVVMDRYAAYIKGIYSAEGFAETSHVRIAQNKKPIVEKIRKALQKINVPFSEKRTGQRSGGYFSILQSNMKEELESSGTNSFNAAMCDDILSGDQTTIDSALEGYMDGDAFIPTKGICLEKYHAIYNTSSDKLARQLEIIHLFMGRPLTVQYQVNHMGVGKRPIWRLYDFIRKAGRKITNLKNIETAGIKKIEKEKVEDVYCIVVNENHNMVLSNGIIAHNCDDLSMLTLSLLKSIGYPVRIRIAAYNQENVKKYSHVYGLVKIDGTWYPVESIEKGAPVGWQNPQFSATRDYEV